MNAIIQHQAMKALNTFGLESSAMYYSKPEDLNALQGILEDPTYGNLPLMILGEGSNILFKNEFEGLVIHPGMKGKEVVEEDSARITVKVGAGENWDGWVEFALKQGWFGLENLSLIPGSVGASPVQNIGAYGVELKDHFAWLEAWDLHEKKLVRLEKQDCRFSYRNSIFKSEAKARFIICHVAFTLSKKPDLKLGYGRVKEEFDKAGGRTPLDLRKVIISIRQAKLPDPVQFGNAGSFFKNPLVDKTIFNCIRVEHPDIPYYPQGDNQLKIPAAWLIEKAGWKGKRLGDVGTWPTQPLVIINYGKATGQEIFDFSERITEDVEHAFGVALEREVHVI